MDDEPSVTRALKLSLQCSGDYEVHTENDPANALAAARSFLPDLILLDVIMPGEDGGDVAARLLADPLLRDIPVIFLTALVTNSETDGHEIKEGGHLFLAKPVDFGELKKSIEDHLLRKVV